MRIFDCNDVRRAHPLGDVTREPWPVIAARKREIARRGEWLDICATCTAPLAARTFESEILKGFWTDFVTGQPRRAAERIRRAVRAPG
jgi:hypothetical protein